MEPLSAIGAMSWTSTAASPGKAPGSRGTRKANPPRSSRVAAGIPCGPLNDVAAVLADPQVRARNMVVSCEDPDAGPFSLAGNPVKLSGHADPATRPPAPRLDEHRAAILAELGLPGGASIDRARAGS